MITSDRDGLEIYNYVDIKQSIVLNHEMVFVIVLTLVLTPLPTTLVFQHLLVYIQLDTTVMHINYTEIR